VHRSGRGAKTAKARERQKGFHKTCIHGSISGGKRGNGGREWREVPSPPLSLI
jgi:hypothetical protein